MAVLFHALSFTKGYVTMRNADGIHQYINWYGMSRWELCAPDGSSPVYMTFEEFQNNPDFSDEAVRQSHVDSEEYGIYQLCWHNVPVGSVN